MTRRGWTIVAVVAGGAVLVILIVAGLIRRGGGELPKAVEQIVGQLPGAGEREAVFEEETEVEAPVNPSIEEVAEEIMSGGVEEPDPLQMLSLQPPAAARASLLITLAYRSEPSFEVSIQDIRRTYEVPSVQDFAPQAGEPFSVLKLVGAQGQVLSQDSISIQRDAVIESFPLDGEGSERSDGPVGFTVTYQEGAVDIVVPAPEPLPAQVVLETAAGDAVDRRAVRYDELPVEVPEPAQAGGFWQRLWPARALAQEEARDGPRIMVVVDDRGGNLPQAFSATQGMVSGVEPWASYSKDGAIIVERLSGGRNNWRCERGCSPRAVHSIMRYARNAFGGNVIGVVVATAMRCGPGFPTCGRAWFGHPVVAVGGRVRPTLVAHEFGHGMPGALGHSEMADEYFYKTRRSGPGGPNCFSSLPQCERAIEPFRDIPGAECHLGCNNGETWAPTRHRIMEDIIAPFGPFEMCNMSMRVAAAIGAAETGFCSPGDDSPSPGETFWGWFKGG